MRIAYIDCFSGLSGDMFLGALVDAGVPLNTIQAALDSLNLPEQVELKAETVKKGAMRALSIEVIAPHSHHHRHLSDILEIVASGSLSPRAQSAVSAVFTRLAQAEAHVHGSDIEHIHFHEVGALDSIADIIGAVVGLETLGIDRLYASALPFSGGTVTGDHGLIPVPAPATLALLAAVRAPLTPSPAQVELVTPTGAALLAEFASFERPNLVVTGVGIGAGKRDLPWPNIARLILGETAPEAEAPLVLLETNIDDMNPEFYGHVMKRLFDAGALDVTLAPIFMKKNRPGTLLSVVARRADESALARIVLLETSTFGLRVQPITRYTAQREMVQVSTAFGDVPVKLKLIDDRAVQAAPEYDACAAIAAAQNVPIAQVYAAAKSAGEAKIRQ